MTAGAPAELDQVISRMLAKDPRSRTASMAEVLQALEGLLVRIEEEEILRGAPERPGTGDSRPLTVPDARERVTPAGQRPGAVPRDPRRPRGPRGLVIAAALLGIALGLITVGLAWVRHW